MGHPSPIPDTADDACAVAHSQQLQMALQLRIWQQQPSKAVMQAANLGGRSRSDLDQQAVVLAAMINPVSQLLPPSTAYLKRLLKGFIQHLEDQQADLSEQLLRVHTELLMSGNQSQQDSSWRYKTFYYSSSPSWQQLQQLQETHAHHCWTVTHPLQDQQQGRASMPAAQLQQLQDHQQQMQALAAATGQRGCQARLQSEHMLTQPAHSSTTSVADQPEVQQLPQQQVCEAQQHQQQPQLLSQHSQVTQHQMQNDRSTAGLLSIHMSVNLFEGNTGCHIWDASFLLAEFILNNTHLFRGKRCLEIGCGPGLVASCLCRVGTKQLLLTDGDSQTLVNCISNLELNGHGHAQLLGSWQQASSVQEKCGQQLLEADQTQQVMICPLDWHEDVPGLHADVIVGSDICYDPYAAPSLVRLLQQLLGADASALAPINSGTCHTVRGRCVAYIATTKRQDSTLAKFERLASEHGLAVEQVPMQPHDWGQQPACFQQLPALQAREERFVLYRLQRADLPAAGHRVSAAQIKL